MDLAAHYTDQVQGLIRIKFSQVLIKVEKTTFHHIITKKFQRSKTSSYLEQEQLASNRIKKARRMMMWTWLHTRQN